MTPASSLALVLATAVANGGAKPAADEAEPTTPKNAVFASGIVNAPRFGVGLGYDRAVHRLVSVGARFEYAIAQPGYAHLQGLTETVAVTLWLPRAWRGFFAEASLGLAHTVLAAQAKFRRSAVVPGVSIGLRWRFGRTFFAGLSAGLRWGLRGRTDPAICTYSAACPATRIGARVRAAIDVGFAF